VAQKRFADAIQMCEEATTVLYGLGEAHLMASVLVQRAIAALYSCEAEGAIDILNQAIPLIDSEEDLYLLLAAHHNLIRCYVDVDRPDEALALHFEARQLYEACQDPLILLRATWQEGILLREIGHLHNAAAALLRARQGFTEEGLAYEAALVNLDLAAVYAKLGDRDKLRQVIGEAIPIFRALRIGREVLASLLQLQQAAEGSRLQPAGPES
jgi:hypothetical protein